MDIIEDHLLCLFRAIIKLKIYYKEWSKFTTVVLWKPGKPSYNVPKAYRPIALLYTMGKVLTAIVAEELAHLLEAEHLLPDNHFGGQAGCKTTDVIFLLENKIKAAWREGKVTSVLFLDIEGMFPNAVTKRLLHNMRQQHIPTDIIDFVYILLDG